MAKYARGKKSQAISDRSGLRVPYTQLKTTWDGLRVSPEDWEPKQPQLTPAKNVVDATALFNPRPDNDPENVTFFVGFNYDPFLDPRQRPGSGVYGAGGTARLDFTDFEYGPEATGAAGTGGIGALAFAVDVTGVSGSGGTGNVGVEALEISIAETGVAGAGAVGAEAPELSIAEAGVAGTGAVGSESVEITGWGQNGWGEDGWGE